MAPTYQFAQAKASDQGSSKQASKPKPRSSGSSGKFDETKHKRAPSGSSGGGQFVAMSYSASSNTGTGYGSTKGDSRVKRVQEALRKLGIKDKNGKLLVVDGKYGPLTTSAVAAWQAKNGIKPANGKLTDALIKQLTTAKPGGGKSGGPGKTMKRAHLARKKKPLKKPAKPDPTIPPPRRQTYFERTGKRPPANYRPSEEIR